ncbi:MULTISPECIES: hypothetical protein [Clostridium]|uniref:N-acetyltransferase domain-containing protein n=1 Tax=Clostridium cadaveris TaxID=1529 RepID=A0A316M0W2_9CLOT|nr:hypothetical protein [Clostridium cadaveris]MDU4951188.1 hypothetical protein [Clostridium sp.]MDY4950596.1 hypothetical protein [Clostridium cadaveris]NME66260.1 hypothetical protein [Clostridium cadaveris]NWK10126.1 hypothetical protein [Clostridium cadaveris]PWL52187.1 MAG: hypothetical protein DBY38_11465 [Clostridium cadaveris]
MNRFEKINSDQKIIEVLLDKLGCDENFIEEAKIAAILHDIGAIEGKNNHYAYEFFLLRPYRGRNIASIAAKQIFDKFLGEWKLYVAPSGTNPRAEKFWRKTISDYTNGNFEEKHDVTFDGYKLIFTFNNISK